MLGKDTPPKSSGMLFLVTPSIEATLVFESSYILISELLGLITTLFPVLFPIILSPFEVTSQTSPFSFLTKIVPENLYFLISGSSSNIMLSSSRANIPVRFSPFIVTQSLPNAIPVSFPSLSFVPENIFGETTNSPPISVLLLFHSSIHDKRLASFPGSP